MEVTVHGKQIDVGDALRTHITDRVEEINHKYLNHATAATITLSKEGHGHKHIRVQISIQLANNVVIAAEASETEPYVSFDLAAEKAAKQLRRYKKKLRDHHERLERTPEAAMTKARDYVLSQAEEEAEQEPHEEPMVIAEMATNIQTMSVSEAVMRLDLGGQNALLFRNAKNNGLNMVYRRADGNVGWVDPESQAQAQAKSA